MAKLITNIVFSRAQNRSISAIINTSQIYIVAFLIPALSNIKPNKILPTINTDIINENMLAA